MNDIELPAIASAQQPDGPRFCVNCNNCVVDRVPGLNSTDVTSTYRCGNASCVDLVTGEPLTCYTARVNVCGTDGRFFAPKQGADGVETLNSIVPIA